MIIGFTGTQKGMTGEQLEALHRWLLSFEFKDGYPIEAHHGGCIGADAQFHDLIREVFPQTKIVIHPGFDILHPKRAKKSGDIILPVPEPGKLFPAIQRNHDIVNNIDYLFATPKEFMNVLRSGTWATIRYAYRSGVPVHILLPDGKCRS
jgi:hypothetical protein